MKPRDAAIVAAVVALGAVALADGLRRSESAPRPDAPVAAAPASSERPAAPLSSPPAGFERGVLRGSLVFTDARDCRVREISLAEGTERPLPRLGSDCRLWGPRSGPHIAYGLSDTGDRARFRLFDLDRPGAVFGAYTALFGSITWSPDGSRAAWCRRPSEGLDLEVGGRARRLRACPAVYLGEDTIAYAIGNRLVTAAGTDVRAPGAVTFASRGAGGSLALVVEGERVDVRRPGGASHAAALPPRLHGRLPVFSSDNCAAAFEPLDRPRVVEVVGWRCYDGKSAEAYPGHAAAWSPDGEWLAIAERDAVAVYRVRADERDVVRFPVAARDLHWRP